MFCFCSSNNFFTLEVPKPLKTSSFSLTLMKRKGTYRRKTRKLMKKNFRNKGKIKLRDFFAEYKVGDKVVLKAEPAYQKGIFHLRFFGKAGSVKNKRGNCYEVQIKDGSILKTVIVHPVHLKRLK